MTKRKENPQKAGRPTKYTEALAEMICEKLAKGMTLTKIVAAPGMPDWVTVWRWIKKYPEFCNNYAHARELQAECFSDEIVDIADESQFDMIEGDGGKPLVNWEHIKRSELKIDARKWHAAKTYPKKFSERVKQEVSGPEGGPIRTAEDTPKLNSLTVETWLATFKPST